MRSSGWRVTTSAVTAELPVSDLEPDRKEEVEREIRKGGCFESAHRKKNVETCSKGTLL